MEITDFFIKPFIYWIWHETLCDIKQTQFCVSLGAIIVEYILEVESSKCEQFQAKFRESYAENKKTVPKNLII